MPRRSKAAPAPALSPSGWNPDVVFATLADPVRRRILLVLADGIGRTSSQIAPSCHRKTDAVLKHLIIMRQAGWVQMLPAVPGRRGNVYALSPAVPVETTETGLRFNFGCCTVPA